MSLSATDRQQCNVLPADLRIQQASAVFIPEASSTEKWLAALVCVLSFAYLCLFRRYTTMEPDEGIILQGAQRILHGEIPYRDFFTFYTPGSYYLLAGLFKLFGNSFMVARTALAVCGAVSSSVCYLLARRVCSRQSALFAAALVTLTALPFRFLVLHNWDSTLWACLALYCSVRFLESPRPVWIFAAATFISFTVLFEQSKGAGLLLGIAGGLSLIFMKDRHHNWPQTHKWKTNVVIAGLAGLIWPVAITVGYFAAHGSLSFMVADCAWPLQHYSAANRVPYGYQNWSESSRALLFEQGSLLKRCIALLVVSPCFLIPALPIFASGVLVQGIFGQRSGPSPQTRANYYLLVSATIAGLLVSVVLTRTDILHFMYLAPILFLVLAWIVDGRDVPGNLFKALHPWLQQLLL